MVTISMCTQIMMKIYLFMKKVIYFYFLFKDTDQFNYGQFLPEYSSILFTLILFFLGFYYSYKNKNNFTYYLSPLIGIFILTISAFGFPSNNFDPKLGIH